MGNTQSILIVAIVAIVGIVVMVHTMKSSATSVFGDEDIVGQAFVSSGEEDESAACSSSGVHHVLKKSRLQAKNFCGGNVGDCNSGQSCKMVNFARGPGGMNSFFCQCR